MPCSTHALSAASIPVQPSQFPNAAFAPSAVARQVSSVMVTRVRVSSSSDSNSKVVRVLPSSRVEERASLKRWLGARPRAATITELQTQLDTFREHYNTARPHRARGTTPASAYAASPKALPAGARPDAIHYRIRHDHVGNNGKISFRRAARMHHLGVGVAHHGAPVLLIADETTVTVVHQRTGEIIATNTIDPDKTYWRNTQKEPGRWPGSLT